jgi:endogenous inhibitor of DNA gyrase (YacG/DUF329 family)
MRTGEKTDCPVCKQNVATYLEGGRVRIGIHGLGGTMCLGSWEPITTACPVCGTQVEMEKAGRVRIYARHGRGGKQCEGGGMKVVEI